MVASIQWAQGFAEVNLYNSDIVSITKVDDLTVEIKTDGPDAMLLSNLCHHGNAIVPKSLIDSGHDFNTDPVGTGPYKLVEWKRGDSLTFEAFEDYFKGPAKIKNMTWKIIPEGSSRTIALEAGEIDFIVEVEAMDGKVSRYLFDCGWNYDWMEESFKREGIDNMLANGEIDGFIQTHEHMDHYWAFPVVAKYGPSVHVYTPSTFYPQGKQYIKDSGHTGEVTEVKKGLFSLQPGVALYQFECPIIFKVFGEMSLYCNVKDVGLVSITGCCHQGIILFADTAYKELKYEKDQFYGLYGGLHISPFDDWDPKYDDLVIGLKKWNLQRVGCNHCTGLITAQKFVDAGYPVVQGTARFRSKTTNYLGNGDIITFPA